MFKLNFFEMAKIIFPNIVHDAVKLSGLAKSEVTVMCLKWWETKEKMRKWRSTDRHAL